MTLAWLTDIHLNFLLPDDLVMFLALCRNCPADAFVITGDVAEAPDIESYLQQLSNGIPRPVYFVLGNHDYYRGGISGTRQVVEAMTKQHDHLSYLTAHGIVRLTEKTCIVGHDGWADGRLGDLSSSGVVLNDWILIEEFRQQVEDPRVTESELLRPDIRADHLVLMQSLAQEAADHFDRLLPEALLLYDHIVVATHVPPFAEACWHEGAQSGPDYLPHFASAVVGDVLERHMIGHPDKAMTVLCGHTHGQGQAEILPNLTVLTGGAEYGFPRIQLLICIS